MSPTAKSNPGYPKIPASNFICPSSPEQSRMRYFNIGKLACFWVLDGFRASISFEYADRALRSGSQEVDTQKRSKGKIEKVSEVGKLKARR